MIAVRILCVSMKISLNIRVNAAHAVLTYAEKGIPKITSALREINLWNCIHAASAYIQVFLIKPEMWNYGLNPAVFLLKCEEFKLVNCTGGGT